MHGSSRHKLIIFLLTITIILARPVVVFSSPVLQQLLSLELRSYGFTRAIRKRKEIIYTHEEFTLAEQRQEPIGIMPLRYLLSGLRRWQQQILLLLSFFMAYLLSFSRNIRPVAQLLPQRSRYKAVSTFLI